MDLNVERKESLSWSEPEQVIECRVDLSSLAIEGPKQALVRLRIVQLLEEFEGRRVLVATAEEVLEVEGELSASARQTILHPAYLIEETRGRGRRAELPEDLKGLVRAPAAVEESEVLTRSIFIDNVGISVGDLVDLVRGRLDLQQVRMVFRSVANLFTSLHGAGYVHLGMNPWNVRIFDRSTDDGFPRIFVSQSLDGAFDADGPLSEPQLQIPARSSNPFLQTDETLVELEPLAHFEGFEIPSEGDEAFATLEDLSDLSEVSTELTSLYDSEIDWSEPVDHFSDLRDEQGELRAIFDGIDRLYKMGQVDDEIAVTQGFSAPELLLSSMSDRDGAAADIFSLGMFLYYLVAGVVPPASLYTRYAPAIPARNFRPTFAPGLQSVISRATRPRPDNRFASVEAMMAAFDEAFEVIEKRNDSARELPVMRLASDTHIGIAKGRRNPVNQDAVFSAYSEDKRFALVVVADGVSTASYGTGDLASHYLTEVAVGVWEDVLPAYLMDEKIVASEILLQILAEANRRLVNHINAHFSPFRGSPHEVMGSTALIAVIHDGEVTLASLGDSRVYLQRGAGMEQLTTDHNLWTLSIIEGVHADTALAMPHGDALARCLGTFVIENQRLVAIDPQPDLVQFRVTDGDTLLMTTDGLVDFAGSNALVAEDNILSVLLSEPDPALACLEFILLANRGGGGDNIGLAVLRFY